ncbi:unnamed protein product, partial [Tetraodon nigroviridis]
LQPSESGKPAVQSVGQPVTPNWRCCPGLALHERLSYRCAGPSTEPCAYAVCTFRWTHCNSWLLRLSGDLLTP